MEELEPRYAPCPLLFELVRVGYLGKKLEQLEKEFTTTMRNI